MVDGQSRVLTPRAVAEFLCVPHKQVYEVLKHLPASAKFRIGKRIRVWEHGLLAWLEAQG